jgi:TolA-binding protein
MTTNESIDPSNTSVAELANLVSDLSEKVEEQSERIDQLEKERDELQERVEELEAQPTFEIADETDPIKSLRVEGTPIGRAIQSKPSECDVETRLDELKADLEASNPTPDGEKSGSKDLYQPETPLEQVVAMPEEMATDQLTANQERARFVATDVRDYAESVPAGWTISSTDLRRVLQAYDESGHTETVARVFHILDDLGGDDIQVIERRGTKRVVFSDDLVDRLAMIDQSGHDVVMGAET